MPDTRQKGIALVILIGILLTITLTVTVLLPVVRISGRKTADDMRGMQEDLDTRNAALIALGYYSIHRSATDKIANKNILGLLNGKKILNATIYVSPPVYVDIADLNNPSVVTSLGQIMQIRGNTVWAYSPAAAAGTVSAITLRLSGGGTFTVNVTTNNTTPRANFSFTSTDPQLQIGQEIETITVGGTAYTLASWKAAYAAPLIPGAFTPVLGSYRIPPNTKDYMYRRYNAATGKLEDAYAINHDTQRIEEATPPGAFSKPAYSPERPVEPGIMIPVPTVTIHSRFGYLDSYVNAEDEMGKYLRYLGSYGGLR